MKKIPSVGQLKEKWLLAYCLEYAYAKMSKEWSNFGLQMPSICLAQ